MEGSGMIGGEVIDQGHMPSTLKVKVQIVSYLTGVDVIGVVSYSVETGLEITTHVEGLKKELLDPKGLVGRYDRRFSFRDGGAFVRELPYIYTGAYVRAEIVSDEPFQDTNSKD